MQFFLASPEETEAFGAALYAVLPTQGLVFLHGNLGAGKTTLLRGFLRAAGYRQLVKSPTYSLVEEYQIAERKVFHFDLYRMQDAEELHWLGFDDYLLPNALCFVEWPERGLDYLPEAMIEINIAYQNEGRLLEISVLSPTLKNNLQLHWKNNNILL